MSWFKLVYEPRNKGLARIDLPASKSISNRLLILNFLAGGKCNIQNLSQANDTVILQRTLSKSSLPKIIDCEDAGTPFRFLACLCSSLSERTFQLSGSPRLLERPMDPLIDCLTQLNGQISYAKRDGKKQYLQIKGTQLNNKPIKIKGNVSSQFISGLCLISSLIECGLDLSISEPIWSKPYIDLTLSLLKEFGVQSTFNNNHIRIEQQKVMSPEDSIQVESDWSAACFLYCFLILSEGVNSIFINNLTAEDIQGDKYIADLSSKYFGIQTTFTEEGAQLSKHSINSRPREISLENYPDLAVPLILICAFKFPDIVLKNLEHLKLKESNRIEALRKNLEKFGISLFEENGHISFAYNAPTTLHQPIQIETFQDHRIAMSFALTAALGYSIELDSVSCINKSFPGFFTEMNKVGISLKN